MASCSKCGKTKIKKRKSDGARWCPHCGSMPGDFQRNRSGFATLKVKEPATEEAISS